MPNHIIEQTLKATRLRAAGMGEIFMFGTKNPGRLHEFMEAYLRKAHFTITVESDIDYGYTLAPPPIERLRALTEFKSSYSRWGEFILSVQPAMRFTQGFAEPILKSGVDQVSIAREAIGFEGFPTPPFDEVAELARTLSSTGISVLVDGVRFLPYSRWAKWPRPLDHDIPNRILLKKTIKF